LNSVGLPFETDQYNLPKVPLADIGDEVSEHVEEAMRAAVETLNAKIAKSAACLEAKTKGCDSPEKEKAKLEHLRSAKAVAEAFFKLTGDGSLFISKFGKWVNSHVFSSQPARYKAPYFESIFILNPIDYATLSPTVRLYGHEFGIDKLDHLFQQGFKYYTIYNEAVKKGSTPAEATTKAIKWGQKTERTYYGTWVSGVYSNGDLFANYAGLKFYLGMTKPQQIGDSERPALVTLSNGHWQIADQSLKENLLKPFITDHMNEALNPSSYRPTLIGSVRRSVKKYACPEWRSILPSIKPFDLEQQSAALENWNGEDYGFSKRDRTVKLRETCFERNP
jgi:uncharacterized protein (DUF4415 family)